MVQNPLDFFIRRTGRLYFDIKSVEQLKEPVLKEFSTIFSWNSETNEYYNQLIEKEIYRASNFD
jgi:glycerol-3-phosphate dehydrogenase